MRTRIIAAFPGTGKSHFAAANPGLCLDSDSSDWSWLTQTEDRPERVRHPAFPGNYIAHIKEQIGKYEFVFVSTHKDVRQALLDNCIFFYLIHPNPYDDVKEQYLLRYKERGSDQAFIDLIDKNWKTWINELYFCGPGCKQVQMVFPFIDKELRHIVASEGGDKISG